MQICKLCGQEFEKLEESHILPKAFYKYTRNIAKKIGMSGDHMIMVTNTKGQLPKKKIWNGWYDKNLVCGKCEDIFGPYDEYAIELLLKKENEHTPVTINGNTAAWKIDEFNYSKLKLFFIALIWRIGSSDLPQFNKVNLGCDLDTAKELLLKNNAGEVNDFSFILARFEDDIGKSYFADPHGEISGNAFGDLKCYRIYFGAGYVVYIKVDKRPFPQDTLHFAATEGHPLWILRREDFPRSKEWKAFHTVLSEANEMLQELKNAHK